MSIDMTRWLSPETLAAKFQEQLDAPVSAEWVRRKMRTGEIPSVKVGNRRFFTPACAEELERRVTPLQPDPSGFGRVTRLKRTAS